MLYALPLANNFTRLIVGQLCKNMPTMQEYANYVILYMQEYANYMYYGIVCTCTCVVDMTPTCNLSFVKEKQDYDVVIFIIIT